MMIRLRLAIQSLCQDLEDKLDKPLGRQFRPIRLGSGFLRLKFAAIPCNAPSTTQYQSLVLGANQHNFGVLCLHCRLYMIENCRLQDENIRLIKPLNPNNTVFDIFSSTTKEHSGVIGHKLYCAQRIECLNGHATNFNSSVETNVDLWNWWNHLDSSQIIKHRQQAFVRVNKAMPAHLSTFVHRVHERTRSTQAAINEAKDSININELLL